MKHNRKGVPAHEMIEQVMAYIAQNCKRTSEGFQVKKRDRVYFELCGWKEHGSTDAVWRMMHRVDNNKSFEQDVNGLLWRRYVGRRGRKDI